MQVRMTGHQASVHGMPLQEHAITSDDALALGDLPEKKTVVTVGAGYISLEFASIFHGMGMDTHVLIRKDAPLRG